MVVIDLDNRGLSPPEPLVRILSALAELPAEGQLRVLIDREPLLLYPELTRRGFGWAIVPADGGPWYVLDIQRAPPA